MNLSTDSGINDFLVCVLAGCAFLSVAILVWLMSSIKDLVHRLRTDGMPLEADRLTPDEILSTAGLSDHPRERPFPELLERAGKAIKPNCKDRVAPFSDNYCRDFAIYHGGIACIGVVLSVIGFIVFSKWFVVVGLSVLLGASITAIINYLLDHGG